MLLSPLVWLSLHCLLVESSRERCPVRMKPLGKMPHCLSEDRQEMSFAFFLLFLSSPLSSLSSVLLESVTANFTQALGNLSPPGAQSEDAGSEHAHHTQLLGALLFGSRTALICSCWISGPSSYRPGLWACT